MPTSKKINLNYLLLLIFVIVSSAIFFILKYERDLRINEFLEEKTSLNLQNYNVVYKHHKKIAQLIFDTRINTTETKNILSLTDSLGKNITRDLLYEHLLKEYERLKVHNLKQLHFHLPNNESFLRFHRPNKFGDDLTKIRETVNYVNTERKPIDGFEEGRIYNGYRFVYPLFDNNNYLGSVEISFSTLAMAIDLMENHDITANFLIIKKKVDEKLFENEKNNYKDSPIPGFYMEKKAFKYIKLMRKDHNTEKLSLKTKQLFLNFFQSNKNSTSHYCKNLNKVLTLIKVKNPITKKATGIFMIKSDGAYIHNKTRNFYVALTTTILFLIFILYFIKKEISYRTQIIKDNKEIARLNGDLQDEINDAVEALRLNETMLAQKSKMAAMGEMIDSIAHQWMQPISVIKLKLQVLELDQKESDPSKNPTMKTLNDCYNQIQHLVDTIGEFRSFFRPSEQKKVMNIQDLIDSTLILIKDELIKNNIEIIINGDTTKRIEITGNEFKHVIINLINNAKDAFKENNIKDRIITFNVKSNEHIILTVTDTAGGIPVDIIDNIFTANFTTKAKDKGTGIGLYMSKQIIEKMNGKITVSNVKNGACFTIELPDNNLI